MNKILNSVIVLTIVCVVAGALLGFTYTLTKDKIEFQLDEALQNALIEVFPNGEKFNLMGENGYEVIIGNEVKGHIVISEAQGYSSVLKVMVGMDLNNQITGMRVIEQAETPGLGDNLKKAYFYSQFNGLRKEEVKFTREGGKIDSITGATISTRAVIEATLKSIEEIEKVK